MGKAMSRSLTHLASATNQDLRNAGIVSCKPMDASSVERYSFYAKGALSSLAMIDYPYPCGFITPLPANPVTVACKSILSDSLQGLHKAVLIYVNSTGDLPCLDLSAELVGSKSFRPRSGSLVGSTDLGVQSWNYQACTELLLEPITSDGYGFYPESRSQLEEVKANCVDRFKVFPRPFWMPMAFGIGGDYSQMSNIVFMENEKDPWHVGTWSVPSIGGVNGTVVRMLAMGGAHHQDLRFSSQWDAPGVTLARRFELENVQRWLKVLQS